MDDRERHEQGMTVRRAVLGDAHVDRANANMTEFTADFQDFITRYAWGDVWSRPGLERRIRSAITNGLSEEEIKEIILQSGIYCGVPAANSAFRVAQEVLAELGGS